MRYLVFAHIRTVIVFHGCRLLRLDITIQVEVLVLLAEDFSSLVVHLLLITFFQELLVVCGVNPMTHEVILHIALAIWVLAAEHFQHLVKSRKRFKRKPCHPAIGKPLSLRVWSVSFKFTPLHIGVGKMVYFVHTFFLRLFPLLCTFYTLAKYTAKAVSQTVVCLNSVNLQLLYCFINSILELLEGFFCHLPGIHFLFGFLDFVLELSLVFLAFAHSVYILLSE